MRKAGVFARAYLSRGRCCSFCVARFLSLAIFDFPLPPFPFPGVKECISQAPECIVCELPMHTSCFDLLEQQCSAHSTTAGLGSARWTAPFSMSSHVLPDATSAWALANSAMVLPLESPAPGVSAGYR
jgi:hypothetical protein